MVSTVGGDCLRAWALSSAAAAAAVPAAESSSSSSESTLRFEICKKEALAFLVLEGTGSEYEVKRFSSAERVHSGDA